MPAVKRQYMWVNYNFMDKELTPIELLVLSRIDEDNRNDKPCTMTNMRFANLFGESMYSIKNAISNLEEKDMIAKEVEYVSGKGRGNRERRLYVNYDIALCEDKKRCHINIDNDSLFDDMTNDISDILIETD